MSRLRRLLPLTAWTAMLVGIIVGFAALGRGPMAAPDLLRPGTWESWLASRDAVEASFAVLRLVVLVAACYLLAVTLLAVVATIWRAGRLLTVLDVVTLPLVRRTLHGLVGVGLAGASVAGVGASQWGLQPSGGPAPSEVRLAASAVADTAGPVGVLHRLPVAASEDAPTMRLLPDDHSGPGTPSGTVESSSTTTSTTTMAPPATSIVPDGSVPSEGADVTGTPSSETPAAENGTVPSGEWEIRPGQHLWSVAEQVVSDAYGRDATDAEVTPYFSELVDANRDRLADPANPDLVFPGQRFVLPQVAAPGR